VCVAGARRCANEWSAKATKEARSILAFKTNYGQQRAERNRLKQARRQEKLEQKRARASQLKAGVPGDAGEPGQADAADAATSGMPKKDSLLP
jgi:hypothetical protein